MADSGSDAAPDSPAIPSEQEVLDLFGEGSPPDDAGALHLLNPSFAFQRIQPPTQYYLDRSTRLFVRVETSLSTVTVTVSAFILRISGEVDEIKRDLTGTNSTDSTEEIFETLGGYLLGVSATTMADDATFGTCFVTVGLARGGVGSFIMPTLLIANYVTTDQFIGWPFTPVINPVEGQGGRIQRAISNPSTGSEATDTVPDNRRWRLRWATFRLNADATVATRNARIQISTESVTGQVFFSTYEHVANDDLIYRCSPGLVDLPDSTANRIIVFPVDVLLRAGDVLTFGARQLQSGDAITAITYAVDEWLERG